MLRFKHFTGRGMDLEEAVNAWLAEFEPDVTQLVQTVGADGVIAMGFLFEESFRGQELRLSSEHGVRQTEAPVPAASIPDKPIHVPMEPGMPEDQPGLLPG